MANRLVVATALAALASMFAGCTTSQTLLGGAESSERVMLDEYLAKAARMNGRPPPPELLRGHLPRYPEALRAEGPTGSVAVQFTVDQAGRVQQIVVLETSDPRFNEVALHTVNSWRFLRSPQMPPEGVHLLQINFRFEPDGARLP